MATTSIWHVKGYLGQVVVYVENPDKTTNPKFFEMDDSAPGDTQGLADVMAYATRPEKTEQRLFVTGVNCNAKSARREMLAAKSKFGKDGGIVAWHGYQSFKPGEVTPEIAHEIGVKLARQLWGKRFQVVVATHLDRGHLHNHLVLNSVSWKDGTRYYRSGKDYRAMRDVSDTLCREYGLSVIENPKSGKSKHYAEWKAEKDSKPTWRSVIKADIDECIARARSERQFFENLTTLGYEYKVGQDISVRPPGKERFFRLARNFGDDYTPEAIRIQLRANRQRPQILPVPKYRRPDFTPPKKLPSFAKGSIVALHRRYLYLLGYYQQRGSPGTNARMHYLLREDIRKLDEYIEDTKLLGREKIDTAKQLFSFKAGCEGEITALTDERAQLRAEIRNDAGRGNPYSTKDNPRYREINARLKKLRKEVVQCDRIELRSRSLAGRIERIEQDEEKKLYPTDRRKEDSGNGRNRTGDRSDTAHNAYGR